MVTVGREPKKPDPADARSPVARIASLSLPTGEPAVTLSMKPMSIGRANHATPLAATTPSAVERYRAERLVADGVAEWWRSEEEGLEFGWDLAMRPAGDGPLRIDLAVTCNWPGAVENDGHRVAFADPLSQGSRVAIQELAAVDANGRAVPAHMQLEADVLSIVVNDADAEYPIRIDPWIAVGAPLLVNAPSPAAGHHFGSDIALSGDVLAVTDLQSGIRWFHVFTKSGAGYVLRRSIPLSVTSLFGQAPATIRGDTMVAGPFMTVSDTEFKWVVLERHAGGANAWSTVQEMLMPEVSPLGPFGVGSAALGPDALVMGNPTEAGTPQAARVKVYWRSHVDPSQWLRRRT